MLRYTIFNFLTLTYYCSYGEDPYTLQPAYKVAQIQGMSAYSVASPGPDSCVYIGIGIGETRLYVFFGYKGGPEPFHISGLHCITAGSNTQGCVARAMAVKASSSQCVRGNSQTFMHTGLLISVFAEVSVLG